VYLSARGSVSHSKLTLSPGGVMMDCGVLMNVLPTSAAKNEQEIDENVLQTHTFSRKKVGSLKDIELSMYGRELTRMTRTTKKNCKKDEKG
jgi:hypothetical protein